MIILKIFAAPFVLALTLIIAILSFLHSLAAGVLSVLAMIAAVCGLFACFIGNDTASGIRMLITAFLASPFGLPAAAEWLIDRLDDLSPPRKCGMDT
jgi:hypothetical protein